MYRLRTSGSRVPARGARHKRPWPGLPRSEPGHEQDNCNRKAPWRLEADDARTPLDAASAAAADAETSATATSGAAAAASTATAATAARATATATAGAASAATATAATAAGATATAASTTATAATAAAAAGRKPHAFAEMACSAELLIENIERAETDVGNFLFTENGDGGQCRSLR